MREQSMLDCSIDRCCQHTHSLVFSHFRMDGLYLGSPQVQSIATHPTPTNWYSSFTGIMWLSDKTGDFLVASPSGFNTEPSLNLLQGVVSKNRSHSSTAGFVAKLLGATSPLQAWHVKQKLRQASKLVTDPYKSGFIFCSQSRLSAVVSARI